MDKVIGGVLALAAFVAVVVTGLTKSMALGDTLWRAAVAGGLGYGIGWLLFGKVGTELAKESAGETEPAKPAEKKNS